jgi:hypothetical protein
MFYECSYNQGLEGDVPSPMQAPFIAGEDFDPTSSFSWIMSELYDADVRDFEDSIEDEGKDMYVHQRANALPTMSELRTVLEDRLIEWLETRWTGMFFEHPSYHFIHMWFSLALARYVKPRASDTYLSDVSLQHRTRSHYQSLCHIANAVMEHLMTRLYAWHKEDDEFFGKHHDWLIKTDCDLSFMSEEASPDVQEGLERIKQIYKDLSEPPDRCTYRAVFIHARNHIYFIRRALNVLHHWWFREQNTIEISLATYVLRTAFAGRPFQVSEHETCMMEDSLPEYEKCAPELRLHACKEDWDKPLFDGDPTDANDSVEHSNADRLAEEREKRQCPRTEYRNRDKVRREMWPTVTEKLMDFNNPDRSLNMRLMSFISKGFPNPYLERMRPKRTLHLACQELQAELRPDIFEHEYYGRMITQAELEVEQCFEGILFPDIQQKKHQKVEQMFPSAPSRGGGKKRRRGPHRTFR